MDSSIELEIERVQRRVATFEAEVADFFEHLLQEADPTIFASMAAQMPDPLSFADSERGSIAPDLRARCKQIMESGGRPRLGHLAQIPHSHLPPFRARVVSERQGVLNVSARDPEADG